MYGGSIEFYCSNCEHTEVINYDLSIKNNKESLKLTPLCPYCGEAMLKKYLSLKEIVEIWRKKVVYA